MQRSQRVRRLVGDTPHRGAVKTVVIFGVSLYPAVEPIPLDRELNPMRQLSSTLFFCGYIKDQLRSICLPYRLQLSACSLKIHMHDNRLPRRKVESDHGSIRKPGQ